MVHAASTPADNFGDADSMQRPLKGAGMALGLLLAINLFNFIDRYVIAAVVPDIQKELFAPDDPNIEQKTGWLASAFMLSYMLLSPVFGYLGDRGKRWRLIAVGVLLWSAATGLCGLATTFVVLLALRALVGVGEAAYGPTAPTIISDMYPLRNRGRAIAVFYIAIPVGSALGYILGGVVSQALSWHWAFFIAAPPGIALGIWALLMKDPPRGGSDHGAPAAKATFKDYRTLLRNRSYMINNAALAALTFCMGGVAFWAPKYIAEYRYTEQYGTPGDLASVNTIFGAITVVAGLSATLLGGWIADKLRTRFSGSYFLVSGLGMLAAFPCYLAVLFLPFPYAWVAMFGAIFFMFLNTGPGNTALLNVVKPSMRSAAFAMNIFIIRLLGDASSPTVIGAISDASNMHWGMASVSVMMLLGGALWLIGMPFLGQDTRRAVSGD